MNSRTAVRNCGVGLALSFAVSATLSAAEYQLESCQFIEEHTDSNQNSAPPGLDEPLNCDHKCFYDELGLDLLDGPKPTLHDMYSIGWRLIDVERVQFEGKRIWTMYLERKSDGSKNECERIYAPKRSDGTGKQDSS